MAGFRSFSVAACQTAQAQGRTLYALDTGNAGEDDVLILDPDETLEDLVAQILSHHELDQWPSDWSLDRVDWRL
jgi:hypothetical protein